MNSVYMSSGSSNSYSAQVERVLHRNSNSKTSLGLSLTGRDTKNYIEGVYLKRSSYLLTALTTELRHQRRLFDGSLGLNFAHTQGVPLLGVKKQEEHGKENPRSLFQKFSTNAYWYKPFFISEQSFFYHLSGYGQLTRHTLYGAERVSIGSKYSVRGFHESSLSGDQGGYVRNELGWNVPLYKTWLSSLPVDGVQIYAAYDAGGLIKDKDDPYERGTVQGVSAGLRTSGSLALDMALSKATAAPSFIKKRDTELYMSVRYTF